MIELILHGIGDYYLQTDWQGLTKKKPGMIGLYACFKHCVLYSLPFLFIGSVTACFVIFLTHFIIDRSNLLAYLLAIKNSVFKKQEDIDAQNLSFPYTYDITNFGYGLERPFTISIWLYIISDNLLHIICNHLALRFL
jgi:hypothetical protein